MAVALSHHYDTAMDTCGHLRRDDFSHLSAYAADGLCKFAVTALVPQIPRMRGDGRHGSGHLMPE